MAATRRATGQHARLQEAYALCERLAKNHYENFRVVSWFLPSRYRQSLFAVYAFCRHTDDLGDEAQGDRLTLLDDWERDLERCYESTPEHPVLVALQDVILRCGIPAAPFKKLIQANRMDQLQRRFETYADLMYYCDHSANPVGHMVLHVVGAARPANLKLSDATCTALQLANFWQDVQRDYQMGRIYLPLEDMKCFGYSEDDLAAGRVTGTFRDLMRFQVDRAQKLFEEGWPLVNRVDGRLRLDLALFTKGGVRVLEAIREQDYDVLSKRPVVTRRRKFWLTASTAFRLAVLGRP